MTLLNMLRYLVLLCLMLANSSLASSKLLSWALCCSHCTPSPLNLIIDKHKGIKLHFYAYDSQVYVHLSHKNAFAAFEQLDRCLNDVKEWMSTSKLKLNPGKTQFEKIEGQVECMFSS